MFKTIRNAWKIVDIRKKILFTLLILVIYRIGCVIPVPFVEIGTGGVFASLQGGANSIFGYLDTMSGGALNNATIFAMGITPYINSSIIIQLLCVAIPALERLSKEGEEGRKKIATITRYLTVGLGLIQGTAFFFYLKSSKLVNAEGAGAMWFAAFVIILSFTAGTALIMWLGEQINTKGIGNGISMILFAGIVAGLPKMLYYMFPLTDMYETGIISYWDYATTFGYTRFYFLVPAFILIFLIMIWIITFMQDAERRLPVQYAKRVVGRKMYGGQSSHLPIKVALGGVLPIIFASSILSLPPTVRMFVDSKIEDGSGWDKFFDMFDAERWFYGIMYFILIIFFAYFYSSIQYNPVEMANNLRRNNGTIPGIRPGKPTSEYLQKVLNRIVLIGSLLISIVAILPIVYSQITNATGSQMNIALGGTSVIILVGVALETVRQLESQLMVRQYKGFLS